MNIIFDKKVEFTSFDGRLSSCNVIIWESVHKNIVLMSGTGHNICLSKNASIIVNTVRENITSNVVRFFESEFESDNVTEILFNRNENNLYINPSWMHVEKQLFDELTELG